MTESRKIQRQKAFFTKLGPAAQTLMDMFGAIGNIAFSMRDKSGFYMTFNRRSRVLLGLNPDDPLAGLGLHNAELFPADLAVEYERTDQEVFRTGRPVDGIAHSTDNTMRFISFHKSPLFDANGKVIGLACFYHDSSGSTDQNLRKRTMQTILSYIEEHHSSNLSVKDLSRLAKLSSSQFARAFTACFGISPNQHIIKVRLHRARTLLETTDKHIDEIADTVGFANRSHFIRFFRRYYNETPHQYRLSLHDKQSADKAAQDRRHARLDSEPRAVRQKERPR